MYAKKHFKSVIQIFKDGVVYHNGNSTLFSLNQTALRIKLSNVKI